MKKLFTKINTRTQSGFVLLFAVVVSAIIFFIGAGIFSVSFKELLVSSLGKESQKSIFAADSGIECALYADLVGVIADPLVPLSCFENPVSVTTIGANIVLAVPLQNKSCARVTIVSDSSGDVPINTFISEGFNKCTTDGEPLTSSPALTERVYKVRFAQ